MSGKFVRASKYRHVFGQAAKKELQYENVKVTNNAWDSNILKTNGKFISVNWKSSGGGAFAVIPVEEVGKNPDQVPLFRGHTAQVLDTEFDPFNERRIVSCADDSKIAVWDIPENYSFHHYLDEDNQPKDISPVKILTGHKKKVGHVLYSPVAQNILASSSLDYTVKIWNVETGKDEITLKHPDMVTSMSFSYDGNHLATVSRDKKLRVWDVRKGTVVSEGAAHTGAKNQRVVWLGNCNRLATTGFSRLSDRQIGIWDAFNLEKGDLGGFYTVDQSSGILMPFFDDGNKILYLAGKGDGNIRYYEFQNDELFELSEYQSTEPQRGFAVAPKRTVNVKENEVLKCFKTVVDQLIVPISFYVPRKSEEFQEDIYPDAPSERHALTAEEWFSGKSVEGPLLVSMETIYDGTELQYHEAKKAEPVAAPVKAATPEPVKVEEKPVPKAATPSKEEVKEASPKPNSSVNDILKKDSSVDKLLAKSSELDKVNNAEDPSKNSSEWEEEPVPVIEKEKTPSPVKKVDEPRKESVPSTPVQAKKESTPASQIKEESTVETPKTPTTTGGAKSLGLKQSVEKLSSLVLHLEDVIGKLSVSNLEKDERLKALEDKIEHLLNK
ncbi:hypothetical protein Kpol_1001p23 [Vanderwaltozyma polyspora DSM 70294]|uniref:Coronin n=1 Tax=Vanderwaltozyma polyspora (strain ATCC 22028 / DSM 70294 / BCRC 21397 / CBS 2163 / NBRC 10782 / NRRL Y-8283 / UCD 57-17) TaxID=436907 RepID=A7TNR0_VANPO|nr:uncharacterized protein Kpol_1001p23 [Vanderwaltozyma polyspora DSM 70294]EDO16111.1 hypothetical protein Kpol_1001p23 [Vanderwaltozyma polyspora DSM 70294]